MKKSLLSLLIIAFLFFSLDSSASKCVKRKRVGGYNSHGRGSHYVVMNSTCKKRLHVRKKKKISTEEMSQA